MPFNVSSQKELNENAVIRQTKNQQGLTPKQLIILKTNAVHSSQVMRHILMKTKENFILQHSVTA